jgi:hypothetical protein
MSDWGFDQELGGTGDPVAVLDAGIGALAGQDPAGLSNEELTRQVLALQRSEARLAAATARLVGEWNERRAWCDNGSISGAQRLTAATRGPAGVNRTKVRLAAKLRRMPHVRAALEAAEITLEHALRLERANRGRFREMFTRDEALLVDLARKALDWVQFHQEITYWEQLADDQAAETDAAARHAGRYLRLSQTLGGTWRLDANLDPIGGTEVDTVLRRIERELFDADWADAAQVHGQGNVTTDKLRRTGSQRRADALVEMARRAAATPPDARKPDPLVTVVVDYPTLQGRVCELFNRTVITPGTVARILDAADIERAVFDPTGRVIDLGRRTRFFVGGTRRAVEIRHRTCDHPGCDVDATEADIDHITPHARGGPTIQDNGRPRCPRHHHNRRQPIRPRAPDDIEPPRGLPDDGEPADSG